jgi:hypothetical protein
MKYIKKIRLSEINIIMPRIEIHESIVLLWQPSELFTAI